MKTCLAVVASLFLFSCGSAPEEQLPSRDFACHGGSPIRLVLIDASPPDTAAINLAAVDSGASSDR